MTLDLPAMDVGARIPRLRDRLDEAGVEALLVTRLPNIRYLTGFTGSAAVVLVTREEVLFVTDGRYQEQSREQLDAAAVDARVEIAPSSAAQRPRAPWIASTSAPSWLDCRCSSACPARSATSRASPTMSSRVAVP